MAGRIIPLLPARRLSLDYNRAIVMPARADITDYGPPGHHLGGPYALKGRPRAAALGIRGADGDAGGVGGLDADCAMLAGDIHTAVPTVTAGAISVSAVGPHRAPFKITHIFAMSDLASIGGARFVIKVADDGDTTGAFNTTGEPVGRPTGGSGTYVVTTEPFESFPNYIFPRSHGYIKIIAENASAATVIFRIYISIIWLPQLA